MKNIQIFLFWFGDHIPEWCEWNLENIKTINNDCNIVFYNYTLSDIQNNPQKFNDPILIDSIKECKDKNIKEINISLFGDIYKRLYMLNNNYRITVNIDMDCFPISKISNFIRIRENGLKKLEIIKCYGYQSWKTDFPRLNNDLWFTSYSKESTYDPRILQIYKNTNLNDRVIYFHQMLMNKNNISDYTKRKDDFLKCNIKLYDAFCNSQFTPIEHYRISFRKNVGKHDILNINDIKI